MGHGGWRALGALLSGLLVAGLARTARAGPAGTPDAAPPRPGAARTGYSVDYVVTVDPGRPQVARMRWRLAGIDEIEAFRLVFRDARASGVRGTGRLEWRDRAAVWTPGGPYAHLEYEVAVPRERRGGGYDSWAGPDWIATRARHLFPAIHVRFRAGADAVRARARLRFALPAGWRSATAYERLGDQDVYAVVEPGKRFDRPRGWFLLGRIGVERVRIAGADVTVATAPGSQLDVGRLLRFWDATLPLLVPLLGPPPPRLLLVSAPDPMWRGGISGEDSVYVHGALPLRSSDGTTTYLHELVHVWQPFRPGPDARWASEGLAEYLSLLLPRRAGLVDARGFARGVALLGRQARWGEDLTRTRAPRALNNDAPMVLAALDLEIRRTSGGRRGLDDAVRALAAAGGTLTTARLLGAASDAAGQDLTPFFRRHVLRGEAPVLPATALASLPGPAGVR